MRKSRIVLADDRAVILEELTPLLAQEFEVVGTARDGIELLKCVQALKPDIVVTDFQMPRMNGIEAGRELIESGLCQAVVLLTMYDDPYLVEEALGAGFRGFVVKAQAGEDLVAAIHEALAGRTFVSQVAA